MIERSLCCVVVAILWLSGVAAAAAPVPTPIGFGPKYLLPAAPIRVERGQAVGRFRCEPGSPARAEAHVELFADRFAMLIPEGIGIGPHCSYAVRTVVPTGVVEYVAAAHPTIGDLFAVWGQPLGPERLAGFHGAVSAWVGGKRVRGDVAAIRLTRHAEIVLELGGYIPPHTFFLFPTS